MPKGDGLKLYKRPGGTVWHYRGTIAGQLLRGSTKTSDEARAKRIIKQVAEKAWATPLGQPAPLTFADATLKYLQAGKTDRYVKKVLAYWGDTKIADMNGPMIRAHALKAYPVEPRLRMNGEPRAKGCSAVTRNRCFVAVTQSIINHAAKQGLCPKITVERFVEEKTERPYATWEWVQEFMAHAPEDIASLACFMFLTGARVSEAFTLTWDRVDLVNGKVRIWQNKTKRDRISKLPPVLIEALKERKKVTGSGKLVWHLDHGEIRRKWNKVLAKAGIQRMTCHSLRHGFATTLLHKGVDVLTVAKAGGWNSAHMVLTRYGHAKDPFDVVDLLIGDPSTQNQHK